MPYITLITEDNVPFKINIKIAKIFNLFKDMLEVFGRIEEDKNEAIPLKGINSRIFTKCVEWAIYHKDDPLYQESDPPCTGATEWDKEFFKMMDNNELIMFINAVSYLDALKMREQACEAVAKRISKRLDECEKEGPFDVNNVLKSMFEMTDPIVQSIVQGVKRRRKFSIMDPLAKRRRLCEPED